jgi:hypothetical protein
MALLGQSVHARCRRATQLTPAIAAELSVPTLASSPRQRACLTGCPASLA